MNIILLVNFLRSVHLNCLYSFFSCSNLLFAIFVFCISITLSAETLCGYKNEVEIEIKRDGKVIKTFQAGVAETPLEHKKGLMNCSVLPKEKGLFFLFDSPQRLFFWMKGTSIPLAILYFDLDMKINSIKHGEPFSMVPLSSKVPTIFVLEINLDESSNLKEGDQAFLRYY